MSANSHGQGILYIAFGDRFRKEAARSIRSLRAQSPGLPVAVVTDREWDLEPGPDTLVKRTWDVSDRLACHGCKPAFLFEAAPFDRTLYLDTDTVVVGNVSGLFGLLDHFDLGVRFYGPKVNEKPSLEYMPRCQTGVVLFGRNERLAAFSEAYWRDFEERLESARRSSRAGVLAEEPSFTRTLAMSGVRPVHLDFHMNLYTGEPASLWNPPEIVHTRLAGMERQAADLRTAWADPVEDVERRLWLPAVGGWLPTGPRKALEEGDVLLALAFILRRWRNRLRYRSTQ